MVDLRPDHLATVQAILQAEVPSIDVWAFGSRAKWMARDASDLDLALVSDQPVPFTTLSRLHRAFEESYLPFGVDLVDWNRIEADFRAEIEAEKVVLQEAGPTDIPSTAPRRAVPLGECADFLSGGTPSKANSSYWKGSIPWVSAKDMKTLRLWDAQDHISSEAVENGTRLVPPGTILVLVRGMTLHKDLPIGITRREMAFNQDVRALRPRANVDADFLAYALLGNKEALLSLVDSASHGTGRIHSEALESFPISLPALAEQRAIAQVLGSLDDKIDLNRRMNETLEGTVLTLFQSWFVDFDPVRAKAEGRDTGFSKRIAELFPESFESSEVGEIPSGWRTERLGDVTSLLGRGISPAYTETGGVLVLNQKCVRDGGIDESKGRRHDSNKRSVEGRELRIGDILVNSTGVGTLGRVGQILFLEEEMIVDSHVTVVRADPERLPWVFLGINLKWRQIEIEAMGEGSTGQTELSRARLGDLPIVVAPRTTLNAFENIVLPLYERGVVLQRESRTLAALRDTLLPQLISGEIRIKDAERFVAKVA